MNCEDHCACVWPKLGDEATFGQIWSKAKFFYRVSLTMPPIILRHISAPHPVPEQERDHSTAFGSDGHFLQRCALDWKTEESREWSIYFRQFPFQANIIQMPISAISLSFVRLFLQPSEYFVLWRSSKAAEVTIIILIEKILETVRSFTIPIVYIQYAMYVVVLRYFGFVTKHPLVPRFACHVFMSNDSTQPIVEAIGYGAIIVPKIYVPLFCL